MSVVLCPALFVLASVFAGIAPVRGVILYGTADPSANTSVLPAAARR